LTWQEYARAWSALHGGFDPETAAPLIRGWVRLAYRGGTRLARLGVTPGAVTLTGLLLCAVVPVAARGGPAGLIVAAVVVLAAGAPGWLAVTAGAVSWLHEYVRARATAAGMPDIGAVTVGERPTRVSVAISGLLVGGVAGLVHPGWDGAVVTAAGAVWLALAVIGLAQLAAVTRRALSGR
jgi:hypothetical protein